MEIFTKECYGLEDENTQFFFRWYEAIIRDFNIFKGMLEKYENSSDKERLILMLSYICINLSNDVQEDDKLLLKNTPNYFLFSFYGEVDDMLKRHNDYKNAFNKLNNKLGENSLEENLNKRFEEQKVTDYLIEKQIRDISLVVIQLQENKRYLDIYNTEEEKKKDILFEDFQKLRMTEETRKYELEHPDRYTKCDVRTCMEKFNNYEEYEQIIEEKRPALVKMRKTINLNDKK